MENTNENSTTIGALRELIDSHQHYPDGIESQSVDRVAKCLTKFLISCDTGFSVNRVSSTVEEKLVGNHQQYSYNFKH